MPIILLSLVWIVLYVPRIFELGFDADEWIYYVHWYNLTVVQRFQYLEQIMSARPAAVLFLAVYPSLLFQSPQLAQAGSAIACLVIGALIYRLCIKISRPEGVRLSAALAAITWLCIPWSLGYTAWSIMVVGLLAAILFLTSFLIALDKNQTTAKYIAASLLQLASYLTYETFMMHFLLILVVKYFREKDAQPSLAFITKPAIWFTSAQVLAIVINRTAVHFNSGGSKQINLDWPGYLSAVLSLPAKLWNQIIFGGLGEAWLVSWVAVVLLAVAAAAFVASRNPRFEGVVVITTILGLIAFSVVLYGVGGYAMSFERRSSRVFLGVNILLVLGLCYLADWTAAQIQPSGRLITLLLFFSVPVIAFPPAILHEQARWATAWSASMAAIASTPVKSLTNLPAGTAVIYNGPTNDGGFTFLGNIELTAGVYWKHSVTGIAALIAPADRAAFRQKPDNYGWYLPDQGVIPVRIFTTGEGIAYSWDGKTLTYELAGYWVENTKVERLLLWDDETNGVTRLAPCSITYPKGAKPENFNMLPKECSAR